LAGTYTQESSGDWTGNMGTDGGKFEGPGMYMAGLDGSGNNIWRLTFDNANYGPGIEYMESHDNWTTWQSVGNSGSNYMQPLLPPTTLFPAGGFTGNYHHGTIMVAQDLDTARDVTDALASASASWSYLGTGGFSSIVGGTLAISSGTQGPNSCSSTATVTVIGLMITGPFSRVVVSYTASASASTGWGASGGMVVHAWPTAANTATYEICNQSNASITYGAITFGLGAN